MFRDTAARKLMERCDISAVLYYGVSDCLGVYVRCLSDDEIQELSRMHIYERLWSTTLTIRVDDKSHGLRTLSGKGK